MNAEDFIFNIGPKTVHNRLDDNERGYPEANAPDGYKGDNGGIAGLASGFEIAPGNEEFVSHMIALSFRTMAMMAAVGGNLLFAVENAEIAAHFTMSFSSRYLTM